MGSAMTAVADDFSAALYNPAGLADVDGMEVSLGYFHAAPDLETYWAGAWRNMDEDTISGFILGLVFAPFEVLGCKVVGGLGLHIPDKRVARNLMLPYDQPRFVMYGARNQRVVILSPNAIRITSWLSVGAGFQMFLDTTGGPRFSLVEDIERNEARFSEGKVSSRQKPIYFPFAGVLVKPLKGLRLGFAFRDKQESPLDIPIYVEIKGLTFGLPGGALLPPSTIEITTPAPRFFSPRQYAFGIAWRPFEGLLLAADVTYQEWSPFTNPTPSGFTVYTGGIDRLLRPIPRFKRPQGDFRNIWVPAVGVEWRALNGRHVEVHLRFGYRYRESPVPEQKGRTSFLDSNTHILSGGIGFTLKNLIRRILREPISVDAHVQVLHLEKRDYVRDLFVAVSDRFGDIRFRGRVINLGVTTTIHF